jgi:RNA-directed DNA polymerase
MQKIEALRKITTKPELAALLGIKASVLTYALYIVKPQNQYIQFKIKKKNGGERLISAPTDKLKSIQSALSDLLLDCLDEIYKSKFPDSEITKQKLKHSKVLKIKIGSAKNKQPSLSHGFERNRSIITNAMMHIGKKNVLNIDLEDFFGSFNFGRIRGFFIKNENFKLDSNIATVIAHIACCNKELPQGSPCSPVITNLIAHSLDIRLAALAKKHSCTYTRYADDITFSTREDTFPESIMRQECGAYIGGKKLRSEIRRAGFSIKESKTRIQYADSRQDVTGLIVNKKPNVRREYWRTVRAQCNSLFKNGMFVEVAGEEQTDGNIHVLEGRLNFIDQLDHYNRLRQKPALDPNYHLKRDALVQQGKAKQRKHLLNSREKVFSKFLFYRYFYAFDKPLILTEGKTDNTYLKSAIWKLAAHYPKLAKAKSNTSAYELLLRFFNYTERTKFLLELASGGDYLKDFVSSYAENYKKYKAPRPEHPVIIIVDNDSGPKDLVNLIATKKIGSIYPTNPAHSNVDVRNSDFVHLFHNLYIILTPLSAGSSSSDIELLFKDVDRLRLYKGKSFNTATKRDNSKDLSKEAFATHIVSAQKNVINFDGFKDLLDRVVSVIDHYDSVK